MFIPLHDDAPLRIIRFQLVNGALIAVNVLVLLYSHLILGGTSEEQFQMVTGIIPAVLYDRATLPPDFVHIPEQLTLVTYMFVHADWFHLLTNMLFLWVFGDNVEDAYGHVGYLVFYLFCGVAAGFIHAVMFPNSEMPLIGASGAVSGVLAAYLVLLPRARVWILVLFRLPLRVPAALALIGWIVVQVVSLFALTDDESVSVAWWAHIGGFATGLLITLLLRSRLRERLESELKVASDLPNAGQGVDSARVRH
ncbi:MAG TPA: rhomboid family intramembrane serine protease [Aestuariivirgaceae bacterium]|jgi:membrane associated rhomboid family serine protease|nr:rhomboid family intramembrane serine protease [Aestuariivirgaceae bacterium]